MGIRKSHNLLFVFLISFLIIGIPFTGLSQCVPDTINCKDIGEPGEICPDSLPAGMEGVLYEAIITIIAPGSASIGEISAEIVKLRLDTIINLPPGIVFSSEHTEFFPDSVYCVSLSGTPTDSGTYYLGITVTPYVKLLGSTVELPAMTDDTSVYIRVEHPSAAGLIEERGFSLIASYPNPFQISTRVGYNLNTPDEIELVVFNMVGRRIYHEKMLGSTGKNYFKFSGEDLPSGMYLYTVVRGKKILNGKLVKSR